ncbi:hypothetical protein A2U01_0053344, partial [Trifolium medium]|nr:hypothetical protein [Trifolium medium]
GQGCSLSETWRGSANDDRKFHLPGENQRGSARVSLLVASTRSATTQEHTRSLGLAARLA